MDLECLTAYFEVTVGAPPEGAALGPLDCIAVGLASARFPLAGRQPGWDAHSFGFHSDDGHLFHGSGQHMYSTARRFSVGDVVGCGLSLLSHKALAVPNPSTRPTSEHFIRRALPASAQVFFTLNGALVAAPLAARPALLPLFPVVGLDSPAPVRLNFGQRPFAFDLAALPQKLHATAAPSVMRCFPVMSSIVVPWPRS